jgi:hypothetical protein
MSQMASSFCCHKRSHELCGKESGMRDLFYVIGYKAIGLQKLSITCLNYTVFLRL